MTKTISLSKEFIKHDGGPCPIDPESYVEPIIRTSEGFGSGGVVLARTHFWEADKHEAGLGAIVAYRLARRGEEPHFHGHDRFKVKGAK
jgi:hypothetical protein